MDVGTSERYLQVHADILGGRVPTWHQEGATGGPLVGEGCEIGQPRSSHPT